MENFELKHKPTVGTVASELEHMQKALHADNIKYVMFVNSF